ncbi:MAG: transglycosylase SLT domain-containing protein [Cyanobacteria bacterium REEB459]|nr:transglycosylase SLT domain-containing protein [Cyanobacteria bacterium REEB459]
MAKRFNISLPRLVIVSLGALCLGIATALISNAPGCRLLQEALVTPLHLGQSGSDSDPVLGLVDQPPDQRRAQLTRYAQGPSSLTQHRARYLLALDWLQTHQADRALPLLAGLETDYPVLGPYILLARAAAQRATGQTQAANQTQHQFEQRYGQDPAMANWLYQLGQQDETQWDRLLQAFPQDPQAAQVAQQRLKSDAHRADALPLLMTIAGANVRGVDSQGALARLTKEFSGQLRPQDWQRIGFEFWRRRQYAAAGPAYARAGLSPLNLYRAARGYQIGQQKEQAIALFNLLDQRFPQAAETATGLLRLTLSLPDDKALGVLDQVIRRFPERAAEAMAMRAQMLERRSNPDQAQATRDQILQDYSPSEAAAEVRFERAEQAARQGNLTLALDWGQQLLKANALSDRAAAAGFWVGKWAQQLNQANLAQSVFKQVIATHPESYYAWRAAVALGWDVGDFTTLRSQPPPFAPRQPRLALPAGSPTLQELYRLGQDLRAWQRWQSEFLNRQQPLPAEQFVDGLMRQSQGDYLNGINQITNLMVGQTPEGQKSLDQLRQRPDYWHGMYPFPYADLIQTWAAQRQLNPLLVVALIRQESRFSPNIRSAVGATGLMQVMPDTAQWIRSPAGLDTYDLTNPEDNIRLGTWYLDHTHGEYNNHALFAVASYNAGPGNVAKWIGQGGYRDSDDFVEKIPFPETKGYVRAVFAGYWNYLRLYNDAIAKQVKQLTPSSPIP